MTQVTSLNRLKENSDRIEFSRIFLIFLIVYFHLNFVTKAGSTFLQIDDFFRDTIFRLPVPLLSIISGYLFFATKTYKNVKKTISKKTRSLLIPFFLFNLPLVAAVYLLQLNGMALDNRLLLTGADLKTWADAIFSFTTRPINYPLNFLRDLFIISLLALLIAKLFVRHCTLILIAVFLITYFNLEGKFIIRNDAFLCFFVGSWLAVKNININALDKYEIPISFIFMPLLCFLFYFTVPEQQLLFRLAGAIACWPIIGLLIKLPNASRMTQLSSLAFPLYLLHAPLIVVIEALGYLPSVSITGFIWWILAPVLIFAITVIFVKIATRFNPKLAAFAFGGRILAK